MLYRGIEPTVTMKAYQSATQGHVTNFTDRESPTARPTARVQLAGT